MRKTLKLSRHSILTAKLGASIICSDVRTEAISRVGLHSFSTKSESQTATMNSTQTQPSRHSTGLLLVDPRYLQFDPPITSAAFADHSNLKITDAATQAYVEQAADELRHNDVPVAFPTETVYGLGADATRSTAVSNIFAAKGRPIDNPLIVHVHSTEQLRQILRSPRNGEHVNGIHSHKEIPDPIPAIYRPLIRRFWPGPLTIILPNPEGSPLAKEVTAGLSTFGARMPSHPVALALLKASALPLAAPSANASTKPSPTTAAHVYHDLNGRIATIIDGGPCDVGVESTVVDGLCDPPTVLRPGGVSLEMLRSIEGWENATIGYRDQVGEDSEKPKAPGMKYKHYSPKAKVVLFEAERGYPSLHEIKLLVRSGGKLGVIRTATWPLILADHGADILQSGQPVSELVKTDTTKHMNGPTYAVSAAQYKFSNEHVHLDSVWDVKLGSRAEDVAKGLFAALRLLDLKEVDTIIVEGIDFSTGNAAAAVMNRLRKAAEVKS